MHVRSYGHGPRTCCGQNTYTSSVRGELYKTFILYGQVFAIAHICLMVALLSCDIGHGAQKCVGESDQGMGR